MDLWRQCILFRKVQLENIEKENFMHFLLRAALTPPPGWFRFNLSHQYSSRMRGIIGNAFDKFSLIILLHTARFN